MGTNAVSAGGTAGAADALAGEVYERDPLAARAAARRDFVTNMEDLRALDDEAGFADTAGIPDPGLARRMLAPRGVDADPAVLRELAVAGLSEELATDSDYLDLRDKFPGLAATTRESMMEGYGKMTSEQREGLTNNYWDFITMTEGL